MEQNSKLTVDFHERGFSQGVAGENMQIVEQGFWFQLSGREKGQAREPWGPANPQALDRYSYVLGNPLRYVDPTGHFTVTKAEARKVAAELFEAARQIREQLAKGTKGKDLIQFIEDLANVFPGPVQALLELFLHNANSESAFDATQDLLYTLDWMYNWVNWLRDDPDPNAFLDFNLQFGDNWGGEYVVVYVYTSARDGIPNIPRKHRIGETLFWQLKNGGIADGAYRFRIVPNSCSCGHRAGLLE